METKNYIKKKTCFYIYIFFKKYYNVVFLLAMFGKTAA